jgi:predicted dehydrogenase
MTKNLRYGIIGCGMMGQEHIRNIALLGDARVVAIAEPDAKMREAAQALVPDAAAYESGEELIEAGKIDALIIATPNNLHTQHLQLAHSQSELPVLLEKPLFTDLADAASVRDKAATGLPVWVAMEYRYMPVIASFIDEVRAMQNRGEKVQMLAIREHRFPFLEKVGNWNRFNAQTGGTLVEKCCHFFDLMRFTLKSDPVRLYATGGMDVNHVSERYEGATPDILDNALVVLDFACGARASLDLCMFAEGSKFQERISAVTESAKVECNVPGPGRFWPVDRLGPAPTAELIVSPRDPSGENLVSVPVDPHLLDAGDHNGSTYYQHVRFAKFVRGNGPIEVSMEDGFKAVRIGQAAQESIRTGQPIDLTEGPFRL